MLLDCRICYSSFLGNLLIRETSFFVVFFVVVEVFFFFEDLKFIIYTVFFLNPEEGTRSYYR